MSHSTPGGGSGERTPTRAPPLARTPMSQRQSMDDFEGTTGSFGLGSLSVLDSPMQGRYFIHNVPNDCLGLEDVILNAAAPTVRSITLQNTTEETPLAIELVSSTPCLTFQRDISDRFPQGCYSASYSALLNQVALIDSVHLAPGEKKSIRALFSARPQHMNITQPSQPLKYNGAVELIARAGLPPSTESLGKVTMFPNPSAGSSQKGLDELSEAVELSSSASSTIVEQPLAPPLGRSTPSDPSTERNHSASLIQGQPGGGVLQHVSLTLTSRVNLSMLAVTPTQLKTKIGLSQTQQLEFSITNCSAIDLSFAIRLQTVPSLTYALNVYDYEHPAVSCLGKPLSLLPHSSHKYGLTVTTTDTTPGGKYYVVLQVDNLNDSRNTETIYLEVRVYGATDSMYELLLVQPVDNDEGICDFGQVFRAQSVSCPVLLVNQSPRDPISVKLGGKSAGQAIEDAEGNFSLQLQDSTTVENSSTGEVPTSPTGVREETAAGSSPEIVLSPGTSVTAMLYYTPPADAEAPTMLKKAFTVPIRAVTTSGISSVVSVRCAVVLHRSSISLSTKQLSFGDTKVGSIKKVSFQIVNNNEIGGAACIHINSKVLSLGGFSPALNGKIRETILLPPKGSVAVEVHLQPRRVNPRYRKQLTVTNVYDEGQRFIVSVESNNVTSDEAKAHDALYVWKILDSTVRSPSTEAAKNVHFSLTQIQGLPATRLYLVQRVVDETVKLTLTTTSSDISAFVYVPPISESMTAEGAPNEDELDPAQVAFQTARNELEKLLRPSKSEQVGEPTPQEVERVIALRQEYMQFIETKLRPLQNGELVLTSRRKYYVYVVINRTTSTVSHATAKEDSMEVRAIEPRLDAPRIIRLSYALCGSVLDLGQGQTSRQFGTVNAGEKKHLVLAVSNTCEAPLYFFVSKARSVSASFLKVNGSTAARFCGFVRPFAQKELEVSFVPGLKGAFRETLTITNAINPSNSLEMTLKAQVEKADAFELMPPALDFGRVELHERRPTHVVGKLVLTNVNPSKARKREFSIKFATPDSFFHFTDVNVQLQMEVEETGAASGSQRRIEEEIERLEHKLKIYKRKGKVDKEAMAIRRIEALKKNLEGGGVDPDAALELGAPSDYESSEDEATHEAQRRQKKNKTSWNSEQLMTLFKRGEGLKLPLIGGFEQLNIAITLSCSPKHFPLEPQTSRMTLLVLETSDVEVCRTVHCDMSLSCLHDGGRAAASTSASSPPPDTVKEALAHRQDGKAENQLTSPNTPEVVRTPGTGITAHLSLLESPLNPFSKLLKHRMIQMQNVFLHEETAFEFFVAASVDVSCIALAPTRFGGTEGEPFLDAQFRIEPQTLRCSAGQVNKIIGFVTPQTPGPQRYQMVVRNLSCAAETHTLIISCTVKLRGPLFTVEPRTIDFGTVIANPSVEAYSDAAPSKVEMLAIINRCNRSLSVLAHTNCAHQLELFTDELQTQRLTPNTFLELEPNIRRFLYVRLNPQLDPQIARSGSTAGRRFLGGVLIDAVQVVHPLHHNNRAQFPEEDSNGRGFDPSTEYVVLGTSQTKAKALIGRALLRFKDNVHSVDFGEVTIGQPEEGSIVMENPSDSIDVRYTIDRPAPIIDIALTVRRGMIAPLKSVTIPFRLVCGGTLGIGAIAESVVVRNTTAPANSDSTLKFDVTALLDDGTLRLQPEALVNPCAIALGVEDDGSVHVANYGILHSETTVENCSDSVVELWMQSNEYVTLSFEPHAQQSIVLQPHKTQKVRCVVQRFPLLDADRISALKHFDRITLRQRATMKVVKRYLSTGVEAATMKHLPFQLSVAMPRGMLSRDSLHLGRVGANLNWTDAVFSFSVKNVSGFVPLHLRANIRHEDVSLMNPHNRGSITVEPNSSLEIRGFLRTRAIPGPDGPTLERAILLQYDHPSVPPLRFTIGATLVRRMWSFIVDDSGGGTAREEGQMTLPAIGLPLTSFEPNRGEVELMSEGKLTICAAEGSLHEQRAALTAETCAQRGPSALVLEALDYDTMAPTKEISLTVGSTTTDVRVRCSFTPTATPHLIHRIFFPYCPFPALTDLTYETANDIIPNLPQVSETTSVGTLKISDGMSQDESMKVFASLNAFQTFQLPSSDDILISNFVQEDASTRTFSKELQIRNVGGALYQLELQCATYLRTQSASVAKVWCEPSDEIKVAPDEAVDVTIYVRAADGTENSLDMSLLLVDLNCWTSARLLPMRVSVREEEEEDAAPESPLQFSASSHQRSEESLLSTLTPKATALPPALRESPSTLSQENQGSPHPDRPGTSQGQLAGSDAAVPVESSVLVPAAGGGQTRASAPTQGVHPGTPGMEILNCTPLDEGRYILGMKPILVETTVTHDIKFAQHPSHPHGTTTEFRILSIFERPKPWVTFSKSSGKLRANDSVTIQLTVSAKKYPGTFIAHLVVKSTTTMRSGFEFHETRFLRVTLDVLSPSHLGPQLYQVLADARKAASSSSSGSTQLPPLPSLEALSPSPASTRAAAAPTSSQASTTNTIVFGTFFGHDVSTHHFLEIINKSESFPLDFNLSVSNTIKARLLKRKHSMLSSPENEDEESEEPTAQPIAVDPADVGLELKTLFSLSQHHYCSFHTLTVRPTSSVKVYVFLSVEKLRLPPFSKLFCEVEVSVRCRTIRDALATVMLNFTIEPQTFAVSATRLNFELPSTFSPAADDTVMGKSIDVARVYNRPSADTGTEDGDDEECAQEVDYVVMGNAGLFSTVETTCSGILSSSNPSATVKFMLNVQKALERITAGTTLLDEHVIVYNRHSPLEKRYVTLSACSSALDPQVNPAFELQVDLGTKNTLTFPQLEKRLQLFLREFEVLVYPRKKDFSALAELQVQQHGAGSSRGAGRSAVPAAARKDLTRGQAEELLQAANEAANFVFGSRTTAVAAAAAEISADAKNVAPAAAVPTAPSLTPQQLYWELRFLVDEIYYYQRSGKANPYLSTLGSFLYLSLRNHVVFQVDLSAIVGQGVVSGVSPPSSPSSPSEAAVVEQFRVLLPQSSVSKLWLQWRDRIEHLWNVMSFYSTEL